MRKIVHALTTATGIILLSTGLANIAGFVLPESLRLDPLHALIHIVIGSICIFILWMQPWLYRITALLLALFFTLFTIFGLLAPQGAIYPGLTVNMTNNLTHPLYAIVFFVATYLGKRK
jgi:hypothetical protein